MKKVLFLIESLAGGGAEKVLVDVVNHLDSEKFDITLLTVTDGGVWESAVASHVKLRAMLNPRNLQNGFFHRTAYRLRYHLLRKLPSGLAYKQSVRGKYDVVVGFCEGLATKIAAGAPKQSRKLTWVHVDPIANPHADMVFASLKSQKTCYASFDTICCVSQGVKSQFEKKFGGCPNLRVQYNPVDENAVRGMAAFTAAIPKSEGVALVSVGRLVPSKRTDALLQSLAQLKKEGFAFTLFLLGDGTERSALEHFADGSNLRGCVRFLGFQTNPYPYIAQADLFVSVSLTEGYSTAATEALVLGVPIVCTNSAGMRELKSGSDCVRIAESPADFTAILRDLLSDPAARSGMKDAARLRGRDFLLEKRMEEITGIIYNGS
ncbi:MAG: glycosyltransferase [Oscillospiraceae bacterium]|jgi:glycosyltransferase involved in cell wall biosynthesis|nr:glycosyltransferase [Oscillospiraceae bacterium]